MGERCKLVFSEKLMSSFSTDTLRRLRAPLGLPDRFPDCLKVMAVKYSGSLEARPMVMSEFRQLIGGT